MSIIHIKGVSPSTNIQSTLKPHRDAHMIGNLPGMNKTLALSPFRLNKDLIQTKVCVALQFENLLLAITFMISSVLQRYSVNYLLYNISRY